jgi:sugar lactone lactonase YvrE
MSAALVPEVASAERALLGEGPIWEPQLERLHWIDIVGRHIHTADASGRTVRTREVEATPGTVVPTTGGGLLVATDRGIELHDDEGRVRELDRSLADAPDHRFNDGKADPTGRVLVGTVTLSGVRDASALYRLDDAGHPHAVLEPVSLSNGLGWSPEGDVLYYADTPTGRIDAFAYDPATGSLGARRVFATLPAGSGLPDGLCVDADGGVWVAVYGGGRVVRFAPDGREDVAVAVGVPNVTSCAFGGPALDTLFVTTARVDLDDDVLAAHPEAGALFRVDTGRKGMPAALWSGRVC